MSDTGQLGNGMSVAVARPPAPCCVHGPDQCEAANGTEKELEKDFDSEAPLALAIPSDKPKPVELLRDGRGIYGIGVSDLFDYEAIAWSCGVEPEPYSFERPSALILRPDRFVDTEPNQAALQKIVGGFRRGPFMRSSEEALRQCIHHEALNRAGLPWPPSENHRVRWWSEDKRSKRAIAASITACVLFRCR
jgi:hypothetical protein